MLMLMEPEKHLESQKKLMQMQLESQKKEFEIVKVKEKAAIVLENERKLYDMKVSWREMFVSQIPFHLL